MAIFFSDSFNNYNESCKAHAYYLNPRDNFVSSKWYLSQNSFSLPDVLDFFNERGSMFSFKKRKTNKACDFITKEKS